MPDVEKVQRSLSRIEAGELREVASRVVGVEWKRAEFASAANMSGVRRGTFTFSRRHDSHTMFAADTRYGHRRERGAWTGSDRKAVAACRQVLRSVKVPGREVAAVDVIAEFGRSAERLTDGKTRLSDPQLLRKLARARRAIDGVPVWSSYAQVGLADDGELGWMEVHWPHVSAPVLSEAHTLRQLVRRGFDPPELPGARAESVEAGVLHSPALGPFMDITPAVRVIYTAEEPAVGRKPVLYLDRHGEPVPEPRQVSDVEPVSRERPKPKQARARRSKSAS
jgi:hypothetical protein